MTAERILRFQGKHADLAKLAEQIQEQLRTDGY